MPHSYASSFVRNGAEGRISLASKIVTTGNRIATARKMKMGIYPRGMAANTIT
jgi:hypothetical protein